jgi:hypothetical protein
MAMTKYISPTETINIIRKVLNEKFPKKNYPTLRLKIDKVSGGLQLLISWTNGPSLLAVETVVKQFQKSSFNLSSSTTAEREEEKVNFGFDYISCRRRMTSIFVNTIIDYFCSTNDVDRSNIRFFGDNRSTWIDASALGHRDETALANLLEGTDEHDMNYFYEANIKYAAHEQNRRHEQGKRQRQEELHREQEKHQHQDKKYQKKQRQHNVFSSTQHSALSSRQNALAYFNLPYTATRTDIMRAFRAKVKSSTDGKGGYTIDMDLLVKIKEKALP